jgi:flavin reductase (DIM6/NTAB) family NADH-FMN oxidoreductase RutF
VTIHSEHPFMAAEPDRSPARRLRSRLPSPVTLWTSGEDGEGTSRAGLTVSSVLVADGDPAYIIGIIDPLSDLADAVRSTGAAVVTVLAWADQQLADQFGYVAPAPGGPFSTQHWASTRWGPRLEDDRAWAGCMLDREAVDCGWGICLTLRIEHIEISHASYDALGHQHGRYFAV